MKSTRPADPGRLVGRPVNRVDGFAKVTGQAQYAAEHATEGLLHGVVVSSTIAKGKIKSIDTKEALKIPGVVEILTYKNRPHIAWFNKKYEDQDTSPGWHHRSLYDSKIRFSGEPVALVLAESFELARYAATHVQVQYESTEHATDLRAELPNAHPPKAKKFGFDKPKGRGDFEKAYDKATSRIEAEYETPVETHNPMEMFASTVIRGEDGSLTIYDKTQGTVNNQTYICNVFGLSKDKVVVRAPYVGGAFGSALRPQPQLYLAVMASTHLKRSVRVSLTRQQMFGLGYRPPAIQKVKFGADESGKLQAIQHHVDCATSRFEEYTENIVNWSGMLYQCKNVKLSHELVNLDMNSPLDMRAPGATTGLFAIESAMDELSYAAKMDPMEFRLANYAERDQAYYGRPFSSKELRECYRQGAEKFGWAKRNPTPRSMKDGKKLVGWGMATGVWDAFHMKGGVDAKFSSDGRLHVSSSITDIGTGTYTIMAQLAGEELGLRMDEIDVKIGDSSLQEGPLQGGSWTASTIGTATQAASRKIAYTLYKMAKKLEDSPFTKISFEKVRFVDGFLVASDDPSKRLKLTEILKRSGKDQIEDKGATTPNMFTAFPWGKHTHSAVFVEVKIDEDHHMIEVSRVVSAIAAGRILNPKTARSQILGGVVWGIGAALHEESLVDHNLGRIMNHNFAEYHIPVNKDVRDIEVIFVPEDDTRVSPIGVKGLGEIGIVSTSAAIANAIFHATGRRVRSLPITLDKLL